MASSSKSSTCDAVRSFGGSEVGQGGRARFRNDAAERNDGTDGVSSKSSLFVRPRFARERQLREDGEDGGTATSRRAGTHQLLRVLRGQPVQEELIELELGRGEFVHVRHLDVPWGRGGAREGKGRSRQDERHNVQNEARCDPAEARSPRGDARDAPEVSISGTLCSPLTLSPAIAPATGVTHSGARRRRGGSQLLGCDNGSTRALSLGTQSAISNSETS